MADGDNEKETIFEQVYMPELDNGMFLVALGLGVAVGAVLVFLYLQQRDAEKRSGNRPSIPGIPKELVALAEAVKDIPHLGDGDETAEDVTDGPQDGELQPYSA